MNEEIKKEIEEKLKEFAFSNSYSSTLKEWKKGFDSVMDEYIKADAIYNFYVKCDEENNIYLDKDIKIADIYLEPKKGEGIFVNQITIMKTGTIENMVAGGDTKSF